MKKILLLIVVMAMMQSCSMDFADNGPFSRMVHANVDESWVCDDWDYAMDGKEENMEWIKWNYVIG